MQNNYITKEEFELITELKISFYESAKDNKGSLISVGAALMFIKEEKIIDKIKAIRNADNNDAKSDLKKKLPGVTWSGFFDTGRAKNKLTDHSNLICIDIDKLDNDTLVDYRQKLSTDPYTFSLFTSPSGNGLKVIFVIEPTFRLSNEMHLSSYLYIQSYLKKTHSIDIDESGKDSSRLCFLSSDKDLYINHCCEFFSMSDISMLSEEKTPTVRKQVKKVEENTNSTNIPSLAEKIDRMVSFTDKKMSYSEGNRNNYIHLFAANCCREGIEQQDCVDFCLSSFADYNESEMLSTIKSAYTANSANFGKNSLENFIKNKRQNGGSSTSTTSANNNTDIHSFGRNDRIVNDFGVDISVNFWYTKVTTDRITREEKEETKFSYDSFIKFLENNGFYRYDIGDNYQLIRIVGRIVYNVDDRKIRDFVFEFLRSSDDYRFVREMMRRNAKSYMSMGVFEGLKSFPLKIQKDTQHECFLFFKNGCLKITADKWELVDYSKIDNYVWNKSIIDKDYKHCEFSDVVQSDAYRFFSLAINKIDPLKANEIQIFPKDEIPVDNDNPNIISEDEEKAIKKRHLSTLTGIGYMVHNYKDPGLVKAFTATDKKIGSVYDSNGGSGKSITCKLLQQVRPVCLIDGQNFRWEDQFCFSKFNLGDSIVNFNDVRPTFDFSKLFTMMTEEFNFRKMRMDTIVVPFDDSPKIFLSTNHTLKGEGSSYRRRQHIVEFSDFFNDNNTIQSYFNRQFFYDWDDEEYSRFYACMAYCVKLFLEKGLVPFPMENYAIRKIIQYAGEEFVDWCDEVIIPGTEYQKNDLIVQFKQNLPGHQFSKDNKTHGFTKSLKMWAEAKHMLVNAHKKDGRDKRGHVEFMTFTHHGEPVKTEKLPF